MSKRSWLITGAIVAAVAVFAIFGRDGVVEVETDHVTLTELLEIVEEEGRTAVRDSYVVASPVAGRLARLPVNEGDRVTEGDTVALIAPTPEDPRGLGVARAQLAAAEARRTEMEARVAEAEVRFDQAERDAERRRHLEETGAVSREEREQADLAAATAERQLASAVSALRAAEAEVEAARATLVGAIPGNDSDVIAIRSPVSGRILRIMERSERVVQHGTPILQIGDANELEVIVDVLTEDAVRVEPGNPVFLVEWGGEGAVEGVVRMIEPAAFMKISALGVEEQRVNVIVDLPDPPRSLGVAYRVQAQIVTWRAEEVLTVPLGALFREGDEWRVFAVDEGRARIRAVMIGHRGLDRAEVVSGLEDGDRVIVFPSDLLEDGVRVSY